MSVKPPKPEVARHRQHFRLVPIPEVECRVFAARKLLFYTAIAMNDEATSKRSE